MVIARITDLCEHEFMSGSFSSLAGSGMMTSGIENKGALVVSSAIVGGTSSMIGGRKFSNGAVTGAFTMWFNHLNGGEGHPDSKGGGDKEPPMVDLNDNPTY